MTATVLPAGLTKIAPVIAESVATTFAPPASTSATVSPVPCSASRVCSTAV